MGSTGTNNPEAYRLYLEGRQLWYGRTPEGLKKSIDLFQQAIGADPNYALAYTGLAETYTVIPSYRAGITSKQAVPLADEATAKALELDESLPESHLARADTLTFSYKWNEAEKEYKRSLELNPNLVNAHYFYAFTLLVPEKRFDVAFHEFRVALSLDPLSPIMNTNYATTLMCAHRYPEATAEFQKELQRDPNFGPAHQKFAYLYEVNGDFANAVRELQKFVSLAGRWSEDGKGFRELSKAAFSGRAEATTWLAMAAASTGDRNKAFEYLERAFANQEIELVLCIRYQHLTQSAPIPAMPTCCAGLDCHNDALWKDADPDIPILEQAKAEYAKLQ